VVVHRGMAIVGEGAQLDQVEAHQSGGRGPTRDARRRERSDDLGEQGDDVYQEATVGRSDGRTVRHRTSDAFGTTARFPPLPDRSSLTVRPSDRPTVAWL